MLSEQTIDRKGNEDNILNKNQDKQSIEQEQITQNDNKQPVFLEGDQNALQNAPIEQIELKDNQQPQLQKEIYSFNQNDKDQKASLEQQNYITPLVQEKDSLSRNSKRELIAEAGVAEFQDIPSSQQTQLQPTAEHHPQEDNPETQKPSDQAMIIQSDDSYLEREEKQPSQPPLNELTPVQNPPEQDNLQDQQTQEQPDDENQSHLIESKQALNENQTQLEQPNQGLEQLSQEQVDQQSTKVQQEEIPSQEIAPEQQEIIEENKKNEDNDQSANQGMLQAPPSPQEQSPQNIEGDKQLQKAIPKENVLYYEKDGVTYEVEKTVPPSQSSMVKGFVDKAPSAISSKNDRSMSSFKSEFIKKMNKGDQNGQPIERNESTFVTTIEPIKKISQEIISNQKGQKRPEVKQQRQLIRSLAPPKSIRKMSQLKPIREQRTLNPKELKKRELKAKMNELQKKIDKIDSQDDNKKSTQPKVKLIVNDPTPLQKSPEPLIRKFNQIAVMIQISDDPEKKQSALNLVIKLNQERRERELKYNNGFMHMEERIQKQLGQITKDQREMSSQIDKERKLKIMQRLTQQEKRKYEMAMKQQITKQFLKDLQQQGSDNGRMSKKLMVNLKQNFTNLENLEKNDSSQIYGEQTDIEQQQQEGGGSKSKGKIKQLGSIFTVKVIREDAKRIRDAKYQQYQKIDLYNKRKEYAKHVNDNFLPKIHSYNVFSSPDGLLKRNYRQNLDIYNDEEQDGQPQYQDQEY